MWRSALALVLLAACGAGSLTTTDGPVSMTLSRVSFAPGEPVTAVIRNESDTAILVPVGGAMPARFGVYERRTAGKSVSYVGGDTLPGQAVAYRPDTLHAGASRSYSWDAPSDPGTYHAIMWINTYQPVSAPFVVQ